MTSQLKKDLLKTRQGHWTCCPVCRCAVGLKYLYFVFLPTVQVMCESCGMALIRRLNYEDRQGSLSDGSSEPRAGTER
jgi:hypothetical protein